ncbi:hypothetical protein [Streptomyces sp. NPDC046371]|uniref:hypothetical protein n=1 Tax=unclassified Streptomyces TaxID=2593676 RepID=UPI0033CB2500
MRDTGGKVLRTGAVVVASVALLAGCSSGGGGDDGGDGKAPRRTPGTSASGSPGGKASGTPKPTGPDFTPDPNKAPRDTASARQLALATVAGPEEWGPEYVRRPQYLSDPDYWPVLDANCEWETGALPRSVLYSVTAYSQIPAVGGKGLLKVASTVTVHRTESDADWEMAGTLEEALRCPDQQLRQGERITRLLSLGIPYNTFDNTYATDTILERGSYLDEAVKGPQFYTWMQTRVGQVTVAAVVKGAPGYTEADVTDAQARANVVMQDRIKKQLGVSS